MVNYARSLSLNAVPEWSGAYITYASLKKRIYSYEKRLANHGAQSPEAVQEQVANEFTNALLSELRKVDTFFVEKERELREDNAHLVADFQKLEDIIEKVHNGELVDKAASDEEASEDESDDDAKPRRSSEDTYAKRKGMIPRAAQYAVNRVYAGHDEEAQHAGNAGNAASSTQHWIVDMQILYKHRIAAAYLGVSELDQYVTMNHAGFNKILKKFDKIVDLHIRMPFMRDHVDRSFAFLPDTRAAVRAMQSTLIDMYAKLGMYPDDKALAERELMSQLREKVVWERNTVWREMLGLERNSARPFVPSGSGASGINARHPLATTSVDPASLAPAQSDVAMHHPLGDAVAEREPLIVNAPDGAPLHYGRKRTLVSWIAAHTKPIYLVASLAVFALILHANWFERVEEQNCLALLVFVSFLWAVEALPLFVTAFLVPFLIVTLRVIRVPASDGSHHSVRLSAPDATKYIFAQMFSPTLMLLLGGFSLASAISKQSIDKVLATCILRMAGTSPHRILLAYMLVACFASMWISNVAAPVLCYSLIHSILRTLPPPPESQYARALILGIALASNIGGMASPISSPQNLIALEYFDPAVSWLSWFAVSIPVMIISIIVIWLLLLHFYPVEPNIYIKPAHISSAPWTPTQYFVVFASLFTIFLWCFKSQVEWLFGDMGIIAIVPIILFYGSGVLNKIDFDHAPYSLLFLAMGGIALGKAVLASGLLDDLDDVLDEHIAGLSLFPVLLILSVVVLFIATIISHTVASVLVVPIAARLGSALEDPHPRILVMSAALICSAGMGLPISGFPNLAAINIEDDVGRRYLYPADFLRVGIPASIVATAVIVSAGALIMRAIGF